MDNNLKVANGSLHGLGIYTATADAPSLSWGFCRGERTMLICGVLDDSMAKAQIDYQGFLPVRAESDDIRRVGEAIVIFEPRRVVPLFVASNDEQVHRKIAPDPSPRADPKRPVYSSISHRNKHGVDLERRKLIAICGHSVAMRPRAKARKDGLNLLTRRRK